MKFIRTIPLLLICTVALSAEVTFSWNEMLGRVSETEVTVNAVPNQEAEIFFEYGTTSGSYTETTDTLVYDSGAVAEAIMGNLTGNTPYVYRMNYRESGSSDSFTSGDEHTFHTQRPRGEKFTFVVQADPHQDDATDSASYATTQNNMAADNPDFMVDLGDCFLSDKYEMIHSVLNERLHIAREWYDRICHSIPLFITIGNHEGENGWMNDGSDTCFPVMAANERKIYYPNPFPTDFFSGDETETPFVGQRESYYSWEWGDALFVVIDPYWFTERLKKEYDERGWDYTLGSEQYEWLKTTLRESDANFKFIFAHQLVGGGETIIDGVNEGVGRGGTAFAHLYEMGGYSESGTYDWETFRPGWELPIHDLMVETGVNIYFHGHDHLFAMEEKDGVIYQEVPQPGNANYKRANFCEDYGYQPLGDSVLPNSGHMRITVEGDEAVVDYVRSFTDSPDNESYGWVNGETAFSYTLAPKGGPVAINNGVTKSRSTPTLNLTLNNSMPTISYSLSEPGSVALTVMDLRGRLISKEVDSFQTAGNYSINLKGANSLASGMYVVMLNVNGIVKTGTFTLVR